MPVYELKKVPDWSALDWGLPWVELDFGVLLGWVCLRFFFGRYGLSWVLVGGVWYVVSWIGLLYVVGLGWVVIFCRVGLWYVMLCRVVSCCVREVVVPRPRGIAARGPCTARRLFFRALALSRWVPD